MCVEESCQKNKVNLKKMRFYGQKFDFTLVLYPSHNILFSNIKRTLCRVW